MRRHTMLVLLFIISLVAPLGLATTSAQASEVDQDGLVASLPSSVTPHVLDGIVFSIAEVGNQIVLGGSFTQVQAASGGPVLTRNRLVAFNKDTGQISSGFAPNVNSTVRSVVASPDGQSVYIGGQFGNVNGTSATKVLRLRMSDGARVSAFSPPLIDAAVHDMKLVDDRLFVAGAFTTIGNEARTGLAELNPTTGALSPGLNLTFAGTHRGGNTFVHKFDVDAAGETMVVTGNFRTIEGQTRVQVGMVDLTPAGGTLAEWHTDRWEPNCYPSFEYYLNDLDFSPDGSYFVLGSMGGYGSGPPSLCDTISRWETDARGTGIDPTWVNYTGGDSVYALEATGDVVYFGGHNRWVNNPFRADAAGQGAVERTGIGALNPVNGMPYTWDPGRTRGRGVFDMLATDTGLWVGSDTDRIAGYLYRGRIAYFPLTGGAPIPRPEAPDLPVDVIQTGSAQDIDNRYLYRINAGGETLPAVDNGPAWISDINPPGSGYRNTGNAATYAPVPATTPAVPPTTPVDVYSSERWDEASAPELQWDMPVPAGTNVEVRLYFANSYDGTSEVGERVFDVILEGDLVLDDLDLVERYGHRVGGMESFDIVSDGAINIELQHVVENPLVNAIEIVNLDAPPPVGGEHQAREIPFDGETTGTVQPLDVAGVPWDTVRGGFIADGQLYLGMSDGTLTKRSYDGVTAGLATTLELYGLSNFAVELQSMTGLFYTNGRIYYTLSGQSSLFMRYFEIESGIVGAERFTHTPSQPGVNWNQVSGMFLAEDGVYWASTSGTLNHLEWSPDVGDGQIIGPNTQVSGPAIDGFDWSSRALIAQQGEAPPPPNVPPVAAFTDNCEWLTCTLDASSSSDSDGEIAEYTWEIAGTTYSGVEQVVTFPDAGDHDVTLTVTDDDGAESVVTRTLTVQSPPENVDPTAVFVEECEWLTCTVDASGSSDSDGEIVEYAWEFAGATVTGMMQTLTFPEAGDHEVTLTVTDDDGATASVTRTLTVQEAPPVEPSDLEFVGSSASTRTSSAMLHSAVIPSQVEAGDLLVATFAANTNFDSVAGPDGWVQAAETATVSLSGSVFTRVATATDAGETVTISTPRYVRGNIVIAAYRGADLAGATVAMESESASQASHTTPILPASPGDWAVSYWADKTGSTASWVAPDGVAVRETGAGTGGGHLSWLFADSGGPVTATTAGGLVATADSATANAVMATIVVAPAVEEPAN